jgi:sulfatase modifying factor 1
MNTIVRLCVFCLGSILAPLVAMAVTIPTVPVGNPGNAGEVQWPQGTFGAVAYDYRIGTTEVTVGQYSDFLNAVAATDTYGLYSMSMATDLNIAGIARSGASGSYTYSVIGSPNKPVTYVSWGDAARFANWLHNNQPSGAQGPGTTETGAYTLNGATSQAALIAVSRNSSATWFIPTENEWYKAAFHQPATQGGDVDDYWLYPMRTNSTPYSDQPPGATPDNTRVGNFLAYGDGVDHGYDYGYAVTGHPSYSASQNYLTDAGAYTSSPSFYGTFDQGGNVFEWNEALIDFNVSGTFRGLRGGSWGSTYGTLGSSYQYSKSPEREFYDIGFRVATVPEPATLTLLASALLMIVGFRVRALPNVSTSRRRFAARLSTRPFDHSSTRIFPCR